MSVELRLAGTAEPSRVARPKAVVLTCNNREDPIRFPGGCATMSARACPNPKERFRKRYARAGSV